MGNRIVAEGTSRQLTWMELVRFQKERVLAQARLMARGQGGPLGRRTVGARLPLPAGPGGGS
jgi:hypothetical protein